MHVDLHICNSDMHVCNSRSIFPLLVSARNDVVVLHLAITANVICTCLEGACQLCNYNPYSMSFKCTALNMQTSCNALATLLHCAIATLLQTTKNVTHSLVRATRSTLTSQCHPATHVETSQCHPTKHVILVGLDILTATALVLVSMQLRCIPCSTRAHPPMQ